eukprot:CAMPEP_0117635056 /NCGR_PEP_ID=MMETSP0802-20121206/6010_1 /TAXON_ID=38833 /ORGANISM="Micromonas sp., Strain CCMP2099" /LENGTH=67 /DNA_ID=CAMNT_0005439737 /DNA_START=436 /DNA_END=639 /DNA_ORIENTATION=-
MNQVELFRGRFRDGVPPKRGGVVYQDVHSAEPLDRLPDTRECSSRRSKITGYPTAPVRSRAISSQTV